MILIAINPCIMDNGKAALIVDKEYEAYIIEDTKIGISSEYDSLHFFSRANLETYFKIK